MAKLLTGWRNGSETPWLKDAPCHPLQHALKDLEQAYKNFFAKRADFPRFKKKGGGDSFRYPDHQQIKLDQAKNRIFLPKLGWLRMRLSRDVLGEDLQVRNMSRSAAGNAEQPGRNVRAKSGLNKSILDQGWFECNSAPDNEPKVGASRRQVKCEAVQATPLL
ncbi:MAG: transposase [Sulfurimicrobium sp.]|nr:transposase [Sulfurimicrobium sp.]